MDEVLTAAFIIAVTAFFKEQFGFGGKLALLCAFLVSIFIAVAPVVATQYPALALWIEPIVKTIVLFLSAAGGYDVLMEFRRTVPTPWNIKVTQPK